METVKREAVDIDEAAGEPETVTKPKKAAKPRAEKKKEAKPKKAAAPKAPKAPKAAEKKATKPKKVTAIKPKHQKFTDFGSKRAIPGVRTAVGGALREQREKLGLSQIETGKKAGVSGKFIGEVERGDKSLSVDTLYRWCKALDVAPGAVLPRDGFSIPPVGGGKKK